MILFIFALTFPFLLIFVFAIPGVFLCMRWFTMFVNEDSDIYIGDMKIPTFYATDSEDDGAALMPCMSLVGGVFGGIHCTGWFFNYPSSVEAILWRVSSAVLTGIALLFPIFLGLVGWLSANTNGSSHRLRDFAVAVLSVFILLVYSVSRSFLIVEAFISLRHLTPGMLALVKWTSFIPHI